jgi:hypothetical protein
MTIVSQPIAELRHKTAGVEFAGSRDPALPVA